MAGILDATDWAVLAELQRDARISYTELSRRVNLGASAVTERVRRLEELGLITGYHAAVDLTKLGFPVQAVIRLKYPGSKHDPLRRLLAERREILECVRVTGDDCYVLRVAVTSMAHLEAVADTLAQFGSVTTSVVYSTTLPYRPIDTPLAPAGSPGMPAG